jgi:hypothetical protein
LRLPIALQSPLGQQFHDAYWQPDSLGNLPRGMCWFRPWSEQSSGTKSACERAAQDLIRPYLRKIAELEKQISCQNLAENFAE